MKEVVISSTILDNEDTNVLLQCKRSLEGESLVDFATRYASDVINVIPTMGNSGDTDEENDGKVVDHGDDGVFFFNDGWVHKFEFLDNIRERSERL